jgi:hypothetical protein
MQSGLTRPDYSRTGSEPNTDPTADLPSDEATSSDTPNSPGPISEPTAKVDSITILALLLIVLSIAILLAWPWLPQRNSQIAAHNRYQPLAQCSRFPKHRAIAPTGPTAHPLRNFASDLYADHNQSLPSSALGATFGGGALWLGDDQATIVRLGPPIVAP